MTGLTQERLKEVLAYEAETGLFFWVNPPKNHGRLRNYTAGNITTGYVLIKIDGQKYKAHRLAWLYMHGSWPPGDLDHINGCPLDNRIANLRVATNPQNQANRRRDTGQVTAKGVRRLPSGKYQARISVDHQLICLGTFDSEQDAGDAYLRAAKQHYGPYARAA